MVRRIEMEPVRPSERRRLLRRVEVIYDMMTELPVAEDMSFCIRGFVKLAFLIVAHQMIGMCGVEVRAGLASS